MAPFMDRLARTNPDGLDAFVVLSPFEQWALVRPARASPRRPEDGRGRLRPDPVPVPERDARRPRPDAALPRPRRRSRATTRCWRSPRRPGATACRLLGLPADRVVTIGGASDRGFFVPDRSTPRPTRVARGPRRAGDRPAVRPQRRRARRAEEHLEADRRLRRAARAAPRRAPARPHLRDRRLGPRRRSSTTPGGRGRGLAGRHRRGQRRDAAAALPALRGVRLPVALRGVRPAAAGGDALRRGGGRRGTTRRRSRSSATPACSPTPSDASDIAAKLAQRPRRPATSPRRSAPRAVAQAATFSLGADGDAGARRDRRGRRPARGRRAGSGSTAATRRKPTIAFFSPFPPRKSGISDYSAFLLDELRKTYRIDLFHDAGYVPEPALASRRVHVLRLPAVRPDRGGQGLPRGRLPDGQLAVSQLHVPDRCSGTRGW